jgi:hypothetical protein
VPGEKVPTGNVPIRREKRLWGRKAIARTVESSPTHLDKLSSWSLSRVERPSSISEIRTLYERLVTYIDEEVMGKSPHRVLWQEARGLSG